MSFRPGHFQIDRDFDPGLFCLKKKVCGLSKGFRKITSTVIYGLMLLGVIELTLRLQQNFGPLYDFEFSKYSSAAISDDLNHKPTVQEGYNSDGIQVSGTDTDAAPGSPPLKILFMGDSFMQGYPPKATIPIFVNEALQKVAPREKAFLFWNAGYSSYSPSIYIPQAKKLIPLYGPDRVVIDIDESDLVDDFAIYQHLVVRDDQGRITAVKTSPVYREKVMGFASLRRIPLYSLRILVQKIIKIRVHFHSEEYNRIYKSKYFNVPMSEQNRRFSFNLAPDFDLDPDSDKKYADETNYFRSTLKELTETLVALLGDPKKIMIVYHPHLYHLIPDPRGVLWKARVPSLIKEAAEASGIRFYDATADLKAAFGEDAEKFYEHEDMHFNTPGFRLYSEAIAKELLSHFDS
jgi:hypothetical protein